MSYFARISAIPLIHIHHQNELSAKLHELLQNTLSDIDWEPFEVSTAPFRKYFIVHFDIPAPPEWLTQQPMGLEIFGDLVKVNGEFLDSERNRRWIEEQYFLRFQADREQREWSELVGDFEIKIKTATYSNVRYPGVDVPLYL